MSNDDNNVTTTTTTTIRENENVNKKGFFDEMLKSITNKPVKKFYRAVIFAIMMYIVSILNSNSDLSKILHSSFNETCICLDMK